MNEGVQMLFTIAALSCVSSISVNGGIRREISESMGLPSASAKSEGWIGSLSLPHKFHLRQVSTVCELLGCH